MVQLGLEIQSTSRGYFTFEKALIGKTLFEIESLLGYNQGRLKQGADFYILSPPANPSDFARLGTSVFPGDKFLGSNLQVAINTETKRLQDIRTFKRKRLIKVVPLMRHIDALRPYLSIEEYQMVTEINMHGLDEDNFLKEVSLRFKSNSQVVEHIKKVLRMQKAFDHLKDNNGQLVNDILYPSASGWGVPQWRLFKSVNSRCVCRLTNYYNDQYQRV